MLKVEQVYPSDLSDAQWEAIRRLIPPARQGGRPRSTRIRSVINAIFYVSRTGCAWRYLPKSYPPWQTVYDYFSKWKARGIWTAVHDSVRMRIRSRAGKAPFTRVLIVDSQSVKAHFGEKRGWDGFKKVRGRKRHLLVDTLGTIHGLKVDAANRHDGLEGCALFDRLHAKQHRVLKTIHADHSYRGTFANAVYQRFGFPVELPKPRPNSGQGIRKITRDKKRKLRGQPPRRWIVERTFGWFNHYRRLVRDYERDVSTSEAMIFLGMAQLMLRRLAPAAPQ